MEHGSASSSAGRISAVDSPRGEKRGQDDASDCLICLEPCTTTGEHRLCCLKCGHLFGKKCIERWLKDSKKKTCPNCHQPSKITDVRVIYTSNTITAVDTGDRDAAIEACNVERRKREMAEAARARQLIENARLQEQLHQAERERAASMREREVALRREKELERCLAQVLAVSAGTSRAGGPVAAAAMPAAAAAAAAAAGGAPLAQMSLSQRTPANPYSSQPSAAAAAAAASSASFAAAAAVAASAASAPADSARSSRLSSAERRAIERIPVAAAMVLFRLQLREGRAVAFGRRSDNSLVLLASAAMPPRGSATVRGGGPGGGRGGGGGGGAAALPHGLAMVSLADLRSVAWLPLHSQHVRDVACQAPVDGDGGLGGGYVATTSFDRRLMIADPRNCNVVLRYDLPAPGWSCTWSDTNPNILFCGLSNGGVLMFDITKTNQSVRLSLTGGASGDGRPIHSLVQAPGGGILATSLGGCWRWPAPETKPDGGFRVVMPAGYESPAGVAVLHDGAKAREAAAREARWEAAVAAGVDTQDAAAVLALGPPERRSPGASPDDDEIDEDEDEDYTKEMWEEVEEAGKNAVGEKGKPWLDLVIVSVRGDRARHGLLREQGSYHRNDGEWNKNVVTDLCGHRSSQRLTRATAGWASHDCENATCGSFWVASGDESACQVVVWHLPAVENSEWSSPPSTPSQPSSRAGSPASPQMGTWPRPSVSGRAWAQHVPATPPPPPPAAAARGAVATPPRSAGAPGRAAAARAVAAGPGTASQPLDLEALPSPRARASSSAGTAVSASRGGAEKAVVGPWGRALQPCLRLPPHATPVLAVAACWQQMPEGFKGPNMYQYGCRRLLAAVSETELVLYDLRVGEETRE